MIRKIEMYAYVDCFVILNIRSVLVYCVLECCLGVSSVLLLTFSAGYEVDNVVRVTGK